MAIGFYLRKGFQALMRTKSPIQFNDPLRIEPVSPIFGLDRGTPIDRHYIETFLRAHAGKISGRALEVGEIRYLDLFGARVTRKAILAPAADIVPQNSGADDVVIGDLTDSASLPAGAFDSFVCTHTLNFIYDVQAAVRGAHHLLASGGYFVGTVAGIGQISRYDMDRWGDYWRFTTLSVEKALRESFGDAVEVQSFGNVMAAQMHLQGVAMEDLPDPALLDRRDDDYQVVIGFAARKA